MKWLGRHTPPEAKESRCAQRHPASMVPSIKALRLSSLGVTARLVNISTTGLLAECNERIKPDSLITIIFEGTFVPKTIQGRVARNTVASMGPGGRLRYHVGLAFTHEISLDDYIPPDAAVAETVAAAVLTAPVPEFNPPAAPVVRNRW
jgi:PilZ domain